MSIIFLESWEGYADGKELRKWDNSSQWEIATDTPRTGSQCGAGQDSNSNIGKVLDTSQGKCVFGFGVFKAALTGESYKHIFRVRSGGSSQLFLQYSQVDKRFRFNNSTGSSSVTTNQFDLTTGYVHVEAKCTFDNVSDGANTVQLKINEVDEIPSEVMNTDPNGTDEIDTFGFYIEDTNIDYRFDDFYFLDQLGGVNDDFLGDVKIIALFVDEDGSATAWTRNTGANDWLTLDENSGTFPDDYTTSILSSTNGQQSLFGIDTLSGMGAIKGLQVNMATNKAGAGDGDIKILTRTGGSTYKSGTIVVGVQPTVHAILRQVQNVNPGTSSAWIVSEINAAEFGVEQIS